MNRRTLITTGGAALAGSLFLPGSSLFGAAATAFPLALPPLDFAYGALEPHIDEKTMIIHHDKHHAAYIAKLKDALTTGNIKETDALVLVKDLGALPKDSQTAIRNNGGGHVNHTLFWKWLTPSGTGPKGPEGKLGEAIQSNFTSIEAFKKAFSEAAAKRFGSGWAWLIVKPDGKLAVTSTPNQDNPWMKGIVPEADLGTPILGLDVWEHAYYLKYQNRRPEYIAAWWSVVNWGEVAKLHAAA